jgi:hypothetical protein
VKFFSTINPLYRKLHQTCHCAFRVYLSPRDGSGDKPQYLKVK